MNRRCAGWTAINECQMSVMPRSRSHTHTCAGGAAEKGTAGGQARRSAVTAPCHTVASCGFSTLSCEIKKLLLKEQ